MEILWVAISALVGFTATGYFSKKWLIKKEYKALAHERLMQSRNQTMRLNELNQLRLRLKDTNQETDQLKNSVDRLDVVLEKIENLIESNQLTLSETILSRFSKHLRQLLHEGASSEIITREAIEYIECSLALMAAMNKHTWGFEITKENFAEIDTNRKVKSLILTPWLFEMLWDSCINDQIKTSVHLSIHSDTYDIILEITYNDKTETKTLELL